MSTALEYDQDEMIDFARDYVRESVENKSHKRLSGMNGAYVQINEVYGVKYSCSDDMQRNFKRQQKAAEHGLGPKCFGYFTYTCSRGRTFGCYVTETAELICDCHEADDWFGSAEAQAEAEQLQKDMRRLTGFQFIDLHTANVGRINGKLVCIDFGV
jgi:hypothetical protein